ncbi:ABC transporter permease [Faecalicatena contorta]|uniref:ABC transporter permease n=1 Tax=Faecalicatena contorta TaxID=39482 RepID=UPI001F3AE5CA|nr:ABC transporter permease subunit [Faecalicatena contorta]MCF2555844.1 ABC transporter permease subunit [Faecalicatena contorta]
MNKIICFFKKYWITILIIGTCVALYGYATYNAMLDTFVFSTLNDIGKSFVKFKTTMIANMFASFALLFPSLLLGVFIALVLGIAMGLNKRLREILQPIIYAVSVIPAILLSPIALHVAPSFRSASIFLIVYNTVWPTLFATITGIMTVDKRYLDNAATLELTGIKKMTKVVLPAAMPSILSGFITSLRSSFMVLVFAEMYGTEFGMGYFIKKYSLFGIYPNVWSGFVFMVIILVIVVQVFERIQHRLLKWTID